MVTPTYYPVVGGSETAVRRLAVGLNDIGICTDVMTFNMDKVWQPRWRARTEMSDDGFLIFRIAALNWFPITHSDRITMGINLIPGRFTNIFEDYDILHFHGELSFPSFSYFSRKPKIFHLHGLNSSLLRRYFLSRLVLKNIADLYISLTNQMRNELIELGIRDDRIRCLPNGLDTKSFRPSKEKKSDLILYVGRLHFIKGLHVLLESLDYLRHPVQLAVIGPPAQDSKYFSYILELIRKENNKGKHKIYYLGEKSQKDIVEWYQKASIFVLPTIKYEALGTVNLEALACGTPVVATNVGGVPEVVKNGKTGILIEPNNAKAMANAIQYLLDNEDIRRRYGEEGRKWVVENFSNETVVGKLVQIYEELISQTGKGRVFSNPK